MSKHGFTWHVLDSGDARMLVETGGVVEMFHGRLVARGVWDATFSGESRGVASSPDVAREFLYDGHAARLDARNR